MSINSYITKQACSQASDHEWRSIVVDLASKFTVWSMASVITLLSNSPSAVRSLYFFGMASLVFDTLTGLALALMTGRARSRELRMRTFAKCMCYAGMVFVAFLATCGVQSWVPLILTLSWVLATEVHSVLENVVQFYRLTGGDWGMIDPIMRTLASMFNLPLLNDHPSNHVAGEPSRPDAPLTATNCERPGKDGTV